MSFFQRISFRIWLYFAIALSVIFLSIAIYYPNSQRSLILEYRGKEIKELARTVSLGVELSLENSDFKKLNRSIDYFRSKGKEYDFLLLTQFDATGKEVLFTHISSDSSFLPSSVDSSSYLIGYQIYKSDIMSGRIVIGLSRAKIDHQISEINQPVYITIFAFYLFSFFAFFFLANRISAPLSTAVNNAELLGKNRFNEFSPPLVQRNDEIGLLEKSLLALRDSLLEQQKINRSLIENLESEVAKRTRSLNETLDRLTEAQETARLASFTINPSKTGWNASFNLSQIIGIDPAEHLNFDSLCSLVSEDYRQDFISIFSSVPVKDIFYTFSVQNYDGKISWMNMFCRFIPPKNNYDSFGYFACTLQDITAQKEAELEFERLSLLATNTTNLVVFTDTQKRITWVNESFVRLTGYSREEVYGRTPRIFQTSKTNATEIAKINNALTQVKPIRAEVLNIGKQGNEYWLELFVQPVLDKSGKHTGFMAIEIDITDRKKTEEKLLRYVNEIEEKQTQINAINENLEQLVKDKTADLQESMIRLRDSQDELIRREKMATLGMLVAGIAHEVNTPLGAIKASAENLGFLLREGFIQGMNALSHAELIIALEVLDLSRKNVRLSTQQERGAVFQLQSFLSHKAGLEEPPLWLSRLLAQLGFENLDNLPASLFSIPMGRMQAVLGFVRSMSGMDVSVGTIENAALKASKIIRALNVYSHAEQASPHVSFDLHESLNSVADLLSNKLKQGAVFINAIDPGTLVLGQEDELSQVWTNLINNALQASNNKCRIQVTAKAHGSGMLRVAVENDGPQIPEEIQGKIFEEFFTTKKRGEGTGLGLNIVSRIVSKHGGTIRCSSSPGSTVFEVFLPVGQ